MDDRYDFTEDRPPIKKKTLHLCTSCWRQAHGGQWPQGQFMHNSPTEICYRCGHETESGLVQRPITKE